jgi:hypothetical protein
MSETYPNPDRDSDNTTTGTLDKDVALHKGVQALGLAKIQRHIFICADQTIDNCCDKAITLTAWAYLKRRLRVKSAC